MQSRTMNRYAARFKPSSVDIEVPEGLNTENLRTWLIQKIDAIDVQRKQYKDMLQRYSNTRSGKKRHTPEEIATIRAEQTVLYEQRSAYRQLLGDLKAAQKELSRIQASQQRSRLFAEHFVDVAREMSPAEEFNRIFTETLKRLETSQSNADERGKS